MKRKNMCDDNNNNNEDKSKKTTKRYLDANEKKDTI